MCNRYRKDSNPKQYNGQFAALNMPSLDNTSSQAGFELRPQPSGISTVLEWDCDQCAVLGLPANIGPPHFECWASIIDAGPALRLR